MGGATLLASAGPCMCACVTGPLRLPFTVTEYTTVVVVPTVVTVNVASPVAVVVTGVGFSAAPLRFASNVSVGRAVRILVFVIARHEAGRRECEK